MKHLNVFILLFLINTIAFAQVPSEINGINYQGIAREADGTPIADDLIDIRITILDNSNTNIFQETHDDVSTNQFGLFTLIIGSVNSLQSTIWSTATQIITEADFGSGYDEIGTVNLAAVPYAFKAKYEGQEIDFNTNSGYLRISNGTKDANGNPVFIDSTQISISGGGTDDQTITDFELTNSNMLNIEIEDGNTMSVDLSDLIDDSDSDSLNEIQDLTLNSTTNILTITNNNGATNIDLSPYLELPSTATTGQVLTWNGSTWTAQNPGTGADNWGSQVVNTAGTNISGDGTSGSPLTVTDSDGDATNELQTISKSGTTVTLSNGGGSFTDDDTQLTETEVDAYVANNGYLTSFSEVDGSITNEIQTIDTLELLSGNILAISLENDNEGYHSLNLTSLQDGTGTDSQNLTNTISGGNVNLNISGGTGTTFSINDSDSDPSNEYNTNANLTGTNLNIIDGGGTQTVDLSILSEADNDWFLGGSTTTKPSSINDEIWKRGKIGVFGAIGGSTISHMLTIGQTSNSSTPMAAIKNGHATGDASMVFQGGTSYYSIGSDASNSSFTISQNSTGLGSNDRLVIKNLTGNIGIGTSSPSAKLDIKTNSSTVDALYIGQTASIPQLVVRAGGDIGIGTASPIRPVDLVSNTYGFSQINIAGNVRMGTYIGNSYTPSNIPGGSIGTETDNPFFIYVNNNGDKFYVGNSSQNYNVGIGTNTPSTKLEINGNTSSNNFLYSSPKTRYYSLSETDFNIDASSSGFIYRTWGLGGAGVVLSSSGTNSISAPIHLPHGSIVTNIQVLYVDNSASNMSIYFNRRSNSTGSLSIINSANTSTNLSSNQTLSLSGTNIDNNTYNYSLRVYSTGWPTGSSPTMLIKGVRITYTISETD